jgi:hypothetical protein
MLEILGAGIVVLAVLAAGFWFFISSSSNHDLPGCGRT